MTRHILIYGAIGGFLIALLKVVEYRWLVVEQSIELYGAIVASIFAAVGIWIGLRMTARRERVVVREVAVRVEVPAPSKFELDGKMLASLAITPRELEILNLIAAGLSTREIAERVHVSENTVKSRSSRVFGKLGARRRTQAVQLAKEFRLLPVALITLMSGGLLLTTVSCAARNVSTTVPPGDWPAYGHDVLGSRYSPLVEVDRTNVKALEVAWTYHTGEPLPTAERKRSLEVTPIVVNGVMYISTPLGKVIALDPVNGREKWKFDARVDGTTRFGDFTNRGVSAWRNRIYFATTDARLIALDASSGALVPTFGDAGTVDLRKGLRNAPFETAEYEVTSPPAAINGLVIIGSAIADNNRTDAATGEVRAYDARTGELKWSWDPVPQSASDAAYAAWEGPNAHRTGAANAWSVIAADPARDLVFVPTGSASPDYFGGERLGRNDYANSIVALRASTGKVAWHFQTVHHDLWDYDNASPPLLATVKGQPAVIQTTKTGMMFVLNRETGVPIFPVDERPVPPSRIPGERAWPTQPFSSIPPLSPHSWSPDGLNPACNALLKGLKYEGIFTPPSFEGSVILPSNIGGAHWGGMTFDPERQLAIVPVNHLAAVVQLIPAASANLDSLRSSRSRIGYEDTRMRGTPYIIRRKILFIPPDVACTPSPPASLVAIDLKTGMKAWDQPLAPNLGGPISTAGGLVFMAATVDPFIRAFDVETGRELWRAELPGAGKATPMTYRGADGRQYIVIAAGGDGEAWKPSDAIVAFALPASARR